MAHEVETMFSVREKPWHGLGRLLDNPPTSEEAIREAGLDWEVEKRDVYWKSQSEEGDNFVEIPNRCTLVRSTDEKPLSLVSKNYSILQNSKAFEFFDPLIKQGYAEYETAGSLREGRKIWVLARIKESFQIGPGDEIRQYVMLCNGHDGNTGVMVQPTPIRVVCDNTLTTSLAAGMVQTIYHRGDVAAQLDNAAELIGFTEAKFRELKQVFELLNEVKLDSDGRNNYLNAIIPPATENAGTRMRNRVEKDRSNIEYLLDHGKSVQVSGIDRGTVWALYNCAVEYADWSMGSRSADLGNYQLFGRGAAFKRHAFDCAVGVAEGRLDEVQGFEPALIQAQ